MTVAKKYTTEEAQQISSTLLNQLANGGNGLGKLKAMIGAHDFMYDTNGKTTFKFKGCRKINVATITLNEQDLYDITFYKLNKKTYDLYEIKKEYHVFSEDLSQVFTSATGLDTSL